MSEKWTEKDVLEHARELKSPFEELNQNGKKPGGLSGMAEEVKRVLGKNKGIK